MRVYITVDIEGVAGVVDFSQGDVAGGADYALGQHLMTEEANAAIRGAFDAGATEVVVNDGHAKARNLIPTELDSRAELIQGRVKPHGICEGLDDSFDAAFAVGYHAPPNVADGILNHAYHPYDLRLNGVLWDEVGLVAMVAGHFGVPLVLVTGDEATIKRSKEHLPRHVGVAVKAGITRYAARSLHPDEARELIQHGARRALQAIDDVEPFALEDGPVEVRQRFYYSQQADMVSLIPGVVRESGREVSYEAETLLEAHRFFMACALIAQHPNVAGR